jgi:TATA-box binding protein (TBP) (component of TFIID and TFIIIB)
MSFPSFNPSPININTITAGIKLMVRGFNEMYPEEKLLFDMAEIFNNIEISPHSIIGSKIEVNGEFIKRGEVNERKKRKKATKRIKEFQNQLTFRVKSHFDDSRVVNVLFFRTGSLTISGATSEGDVWDVARRVGKAIRNLYLQKFQIFINPELKDAENLKFRLHRFKINMINSDYDCGIEFTRKGIRKIIDILINKYGLIVEFEPNKYVGIKVHYKASNDKFVYISYFRTGKILLKGGNSIIQVNSAYSRFNEILGIEYPEFASNVRDTDTTPDPI